MKVISCSFKEKREFLLDVHVAVLIDLVNRYIPIRNYASDVINANLVNVEKQMNTKFFPLFCFCGEKISMIFIVNF